MEDKTYSKLLNNYIKSKKFWYIIPRAQYFNEENISELHTVLSYISQKMYIKLKDFKKKTESLFKELSPDDLVLRIWDQDTQLLVQKEMIEKKIIKPYNLNRQSKNDQLANFRNHINLLKKLGFAHINRFKRLYISDMGNKFLESNKEEWGKIIEQQLIKLQFFNPSIKISANNKDLNDYLKYKLFPYFFVLKVILALEEKYLTVEEYILFISHFKNQADFIKSIKFINTFRSFNSKNQIELIRLADRKSVV